MEYLPPNAALPNNEKDVRVGIAAHLVSAAIGVKQWTRDTTRCVDTRIINCLNVAHKTSHRQAHTEAFLFVCIFCWSELQHFDQFDQQQVELQRLPLSRSLPRIAEATWPQCKCELSLFRLLPRRCKVKDLLFPALHADGGAPEGVSGPAAAGSGRQRVEPLRRNSLHISDENQIQ